MGMWGFELYQNDTSLDVKDKFEELYNTGNAVQDITNKLTEDYESIMGNIDEEPLFWLALADTQWNLGVLMPLVKEKALYWVEKDSGMFSCRSIDTSAKAKRRKILDGLRAKLLSPQPTVKKTVKKRIYKCHWKLGDVFAYQLVSDLAKERGLYGRYFLLQKVDEGVWYPGHIVPIVYVKITNDIVSVSWKQFDETFETKMIKRYCGHNLRELSIYTNKNN